MMAMADSTSFPHCFASNWWRAPKCSFRAPVATVAPRNLWHIACGEHAVAEVPAFCPDSLTSMFSNVWPPIRLGIQTEAGENISELDSMVSWKYKHKNTSGLDLNLVQVHSDKSTDCQHEGQGPNGLPYCSKNPDNLAMSLALGLGSTPGLHISFLSYSCSISCKRPSRKWEKNTCRMGGFYGLRHGTFVAGIARWLVATHMCESKGQAHLKVSF